MRLLNKKLYIYSNENYYIDIKKFYYGRVKGTDYYYYIVKIYRKTMKTIPILNITYHGYKQLNKYVTYWVNYYDFEGDINKVIEKAIKKYQFFMNEERTIKEIESKFIE